MTPSPLNSFLDWIYPPICISCRSLLELNQWRRFICGSCERLFLPIASPCCEKCGSPVSSEAKGCFSCFGKFFHFTSNHAAFTYDDLMRELMHDMKFRSKRRVAEGLALLWASLVRKNKIQLVKQFDQLNLKSAEIIPMPMHRKKQKERGFNQAEIMARALADALGIPTASHLRRDFDTPPQAGLHPIQRAENVKDIFSIRPGSGVKNKTYILIDDIFTTGASLSECAKTLKNAGAACVFCMTLCISVKNNDKS